MIMIYKKKRINIIKIINFNKLKHLKWAEKQTKSKKEDKGKNLLVDSLQLLLIKENNLNRF